MATVQLLSGQRIGLLTASASRLGGGVFEAVVIQSDLIRRLGGEPVVVALADRFSAEDRPRFGASEVIHVPLRGPAQIGFAPTLVDALLTARLDCLHLHGIWMYPSHAARRWREKTGRASLISPHGMLDPWITARGRWKKALARHGYERAGWRAASAFHALTRREAADIARESGRHDSLIIANAGPPISVSITQARAPRLLYLGRIHPKKNLAPLIAAWRDLAAADALPADARLTLAGWGEPGDVAALEAMLRDAPPSVRFVGPCFGADKARALAESRFLVLPSLSEGLPMTLLEAWAAGTPTLQSSECNLPEGITAGAAIDCGVEPASIKAALARALAMPDGEWLTMAQAAQGLVSGPFSGERVAQQWGEAYARLIAEPGSPR
ncbi:glycosyltransferase [Novosphingobium ginsenosidimutans]|uniref:Glycosyltransferase n=1 Tax=Novosphingobium ginsenosidimutans TaxID=1176536 RepID=A0A5B8S441_9SPHN|nr:glycosyltransferase [Novosphingobium ginsenosidimutans]QEA16103.1 glycosyltransferase [Novosphingobium ginsenosidimutans]